MTTRSDAVDDALERLADYRYLDGGGFPSHGPMGAEALSSLGHDDLVAGWVEAYKARHAILDAPPPKDPIDPTDETGWRPALGDFTRIADWDELFARHLREASWQSVLRRWAPELIAGYGGALTHGLVRTLHAVRGLPDAAPSDLQLAELSKGLALWAASYRALPGQPRLRGDRTLEEALASVPRVQDATNPMEAATFARIDDLTGFAAAVESLGPAMPGRDPLGDLSAAFCRLLPVSDPALVHTVTPIALARTLLDAVPEISVEQVYVQLWHVNAALVAGFDPTRGDADDDATEPPPPSELVARAVEHRDPHVLKFTEACLREHSRQPDPAYLHAAARAISAFSPL